MEEQQANRIIRPELLVMPAGRALFTEGETAQWAYVLLSGRVGLWRSGEKMIEVVPQSVLGFEGEYNKNGTYFSTAKSETECRMAKYRSEDLTEALLTVPRLLEISMNGIFGQMDSCFARLTQDNLSKDAFYPGDVRSYQSGDTVILEGDASTEIFKIISTDLGLEVSKAGKKLAVLKEPGEFFGEMAVILNETRTATIRSLGVSVLEVYPGDCIEDMLTDYPDLSMRLIRAIASRLERTTKELLKTSQQQ